MKEFARCAFRVPKHNQSPQTRNRSIFLFSAVSIGIILGLTNSAQAQTGDEIIERHLARTGGRINWEAVQSFRKVTLEKTPFDDAKKSISVKAPNKIRTAYQYGATEEVTAFDGQTAWADVGKKAEKIQNEVDAYKLSDPFEELNHIINYKKKGNTATLLGREVVNGTSYYKVRISPISPAPAGLYAVRSKDFYFNSVDYTLVKLRLLLGTVKGSFFRQIVYGDYKTVNGLLLPFTEKTSIIGVEGVDSTKVRLATVKSIEINLDIDDKEFNFPGDVVASKSSASIVKSGVDRQTANLLTSSLNWKPIQKSDKTYELRWASPREMLTINKECADELVYSGAMDGSIIYGQCRIYYENGYFEGTIKPLDLRTLVVNLTFSQRHIAADRVEVISGKFFDCSDNFLVRIGQGSLAAALPYLKRNSKIALDLFDDANLQKSLEITLWTILQEASPRKDMTIYPTPIGLTMAGVVGLNYKALQESAKSKWLEKLNDRMSQPYPIIDFYKQKRWFPTAAYPDFIGPFDIEEDTGQTLLLVSRSKRASYEARKSDRQDDMKVAQQQLARQQANAAMKQEQLNSVVTQLGLTPAEFSAFNNQMAARTDALTYVNVDLSNAAFKIPELKFITRISPKVYPYYGNVSVKLIDASEQEVGTYSYVYDHKPAIDIYGLYNDSSRELKANVTSTKSINRYDVYCDGKKMSTVKYERTQQSTSYDGGSFLGALLEGFAGSMANRAGVSGFEQQLFLEAQLKGCSYKGNDLKKTKVQAQSLFTKAKYYVDIKKYADAIEQVDGAIYADDGAIYREYRGYLFDRTNQIENAFQDYLWLIQNGNLSPVKRGETYRKIAYLLAKIPSSIRVKTYTLYADYAPIYLMKAATLGDIQSKAVLSKAKTSEEQLQLLRMTK